MACSEWHNISHELSSQTRSLSVFLADQTRRVAARTAASVHGASAFLIPRHLSVVMQAPDLGTDEGARWVADAA